MAVDADDRLRLLLLEFAVQDCFGVKEFIVNVAQLFPQLSEVAMLDRLKRELAELASLDLIRVHKGSQCSANSLAGDDMTVRPDEIASLNENYFTPYTDEMVCICSTTETQRAYDDTYAAMQEAAI